MGVEGRAWRRLSARLRSRGEASARWARWAAGRGVIDSGGSTCASQGPASLLARARRPTAGGPARAAIVRRDRVRGRQAGRQASRRASAGGRRHRNAHSPPRFAGALFLPRSSQRGIGQARSATWRRLGPSRGRAEAGHRPAQGGPDRAAQGGAGGTLLRRSLASSGRQAGRPARSPAPSPSPQLAVPRSLRLPQQGAGFVAGRRSRSSGSGSSGAVRAGIPQVDALFPPRAAAAFFGRGQGQLADGWGGRSAGLRMACRRVRKEFFGRSRYPLIACLMILNEVEH